MVWQASLILLLSACNTLRSVEICRIELPTANCSIRDKTVIKQYPDDLLEWKAMSEQDLDYLASKLEQCEVDSKLPKNDNTFDELSLCTISKLNCGLLEHWQVNGYYSFSPLSIRRIKSKLDFCKR
jgi:endo-beta-N-acetylglucosaminidase D